MIIKTLFKVGLLLFCTALVCAQENATPPENSVPAQEVPAETDSSVQAQNASAQPAQSAPTSQQIVPAENSIPSPQGDVVKESNAQEQQTPPIIQNPEPASGSSSPDVPVSTPQATPETSQPETSDKGSQQAPAAKPEENTGSPINLQNLTEEQKRQLLHQQALRAQLEGNQELKLGGLANFTVEQQIQLQKKFAEEARVMYERAKKELQQREAKQKAEIQKLLRQAKLTRSEEINMRQKEKLRSTRDLWGNNHARDEYMFEMEPDAEQDFLLSIPVAQRIGFLISIYTNEDGVYVRSTDLDDEKPLTIRIFQNNHITIYEQALYFNDAHVFDGKDDTTYTLRFTNSYKHRLVSLRISQVLQKAQIQSKLTSKDVTSYSTRTYNLYTSTTQKFKGLSDKQIVEFSSKKKLGQKIEQYYLFNLAEIIVFVVLVLVQIEMIRKLLSSSSIV